MSTEDVTTEIAAVLRRHGDVPDGNGRYTTPLEDALFNVWAEAGDDVGDYEIGTRLAEAAIRVTTDALADPLAARDRRVRAEAWDAGWQTGQLWAFSDLDEYGKHTNPHREADA